LDNVFERFQNIQELAIVKQACHLSASRCRIQQKYLSILSTTLESDRLPHNVIRLPLLDTEIRGIESLQQFAQHLMHPCAELYANQSILDTTASQSILQQLEVILGQEKQVSGVEDTPPPTQQVDPALIGSMQQLMMQPDGIPRLLQHPSVLAILQSDEDSPLKPLFDDLEKSGVFGALMHLGNPVVREQLLQLAPTVLKDLGVLEK